MLFTRLRPCTPPPMAVHRRLTSPTCTIAQQRVDDLFHNARAHSPLLMLERSIRPNTLDTALWNTSAFAAQVHPDIPLVTSWKDVQKLWSTAQAAQTTTAAARAVGDARWTVNTMGVQTRRTPEQLRQALLAKAGEGDVDALLVVSGSHLARRVPGAQRCETSQHAPTLVVTPPQAAERFRRSVAARLSHARGWHASPLARPVVRRQPAAARRSTAASQGRGWGAGGADAAAAALGGV